MKDVAINQELS